MFFRQVGNVVIESLSFVLNICNCQTNTVRECAYFQYSVLLMRL